MKRFLFTLLLATIIAGGGWSLYHRHEINSLGDMWRLASGQLGFEDPSQTGPSGNNPFQQASAAVAGGRGLRQGSAGRSPFPSIANNLQPQDYFDREVVRIASFKIAGGNARHGIDTAILAEICQQYDVVAIQNTGQTNLVPNLIGQLNTRGNDFVFVDRKDGAGNLAIVFNQQTLILDQQQWYTVNDPDNVMSNEPLVAWFRVRNAPPELAFTFTLANCQLDPSRPDLELAYLGELFRAIRDDGRGEDDVIMVGDFNAGDRGLNAIEYKTGLKCAIVGIPTNTQNSAQLDNILYNPQATNEFTGNRGVYDFMRQFNMTLADALDVSTHMPVWAEFSIYEGHSPGRVSEALRVPQSR